MVSPFRAALAVLSASAAAACAALDVTFTCKVPPLNQVRTVSVEEALELQASVSADGKVIQKLAEGRSSTKVKRETVLAASEEAVTALKETYVKMQDCSRAPDGKLKTREGPLQGKTYVVKHTGKELAVALEKDRPAPIEEAALVRSDLRNLGQPDRLGRYLHGRTLKEGVRIEVTGETGKALLQMGEEDGQLETFALVLHRACQAAGMRCAVFKVELRLVKPDPDLGARMTMALEGEMTIGIENCWPVQLALAGNLRLEGRKAEAGVVRTIEGGGTIRQTVNVEYGK